MFFFCCGEVYILWSQATDRPKNCKRRGRKKKTHSNHPRSQCSFCERRHRVLLLTKQVEIHRFSRHGAGAWRCRWCCRRLSHGPCAYPSSPLNPVNERPNAGQYGDGQGRDGQGCSKENQCRWAITSISCLKERLLSLILLINTIVVKYTVYLRLWPPHRKGFLLLKKHGGQM